MALGRYGVQARHLRAVRAAAERETSLIEQIVAPTLRQRSPGARERAGQTAREIAALALQLHAALVTAALADAGYGGPVAGRGGACPQRGGMLETGPGNAGGRAGVR